MLNDLLNEVPHPRSTASIHNDVETVFLDGRWVNRMVETGAVISVSLTRATALEIGASLAASWLGRHHVLYYAPNQSPSISGHDPLNAL